MTDRDRIATSLLALRLGVFIVMVMWTLDKFVNASHAARVFEGFYGVGGLGQPVMAAIGIAELLLILAFVVGYQKRISYGGVLLLHGISTLSSYRQYLDPSVLRRLAHAGGLRCVVLAARFRHPVDRRPCTVCTQKLITWYPSETARLRLGCPSNSSRRVTSCCSIGRRANGRRVRRDDSDSGVRRHRRRPHRRTRRAPRLDRLALLAAVRPPVDLRRAARRARRILAAGAGRAVPRDAALYPRVAQGHRRFACLF